MSAARPESVDSAAHSPFAGGRPLVCVQGIGFVGTAMALAVASARDDAGRPAFDVAGVELDSPGGREKAQALAGGRLPVESADPRMGAALGEAIEVGNLVGTTDQSIYAAADVVIVDINLDLQLGEEGEPRVDFSALRASARSLGGLLRPGALVIIETTVPPGTCDKVVAPELEGALEERGLPGDAILLAHAYERVMPGADYFDSIVNYWRVYAGRTPEAADACEAFLSAVVNVDEYPLTRLPSTAASEIGKLLENSYRAATIAYMEEWGRFAEAVEVDLFEVIDAIRMRPTHSNIRQPGFGVGGYCLTKDPLFAQFGARELFGLEALEFPFSARSVQVNTEMPLVTLDKLDELLPGLEGRRILLLGVSYREGVGDTRYSPSELFLDRAGARGAEVVAHDPMVSEWPGHEVLTGELPSPDGFDAVVFAVPHADYVTVDVEAWLGSERPLVVDANRVLDLGRLRRLAAAGCPVWTIGRGPITE